MAFWGIAGKDERQKAALRALNNDKPFTVLTGEAGTGKSLLGQAVGLHKMFEDKKFRKMIYTRLQVQMGKDLGYLTGDANDKTLPFMIPFLDNLEVMSDQEGVRNIKDYIFFGEESGVKGSSKKQIFFDPIQTMRGSTKHEAYVMIDEAQNIDNATMHGITTRIGSGSKYIIMGNFSQIDDKSLRNNVNNGFYTFLNGLYKHDPNGEYFDHVHLTEVQRHPVIKVIETIFKEDTMNPVFEELEMRGL